MDLKNSDDLLKYLAEKNIEEKTFEHPPVHTVDESRALRGDIPGAHTKNLFLRDGKKRYFLLVTDENTSINLKSLSKKVGAKAGLSFGSANALMDMLGVEPGSVSALAALNDREHKVTVVLDEALLRTPPINCHPLTNQRTTSLSKEGLLAFLSETGHTPLYVAFNEEDKT